MEKTLENLNYNAIQQLLLEYNNDSDVQKLRNYYYSKSIPEIFAVSRRELSHSAFLAWLFDSNCNFELGLFPLKKLLEILIRRQKSELTQDLINTILTDNLPFNSLFVKTEDAVVKGRIDILIEFNKDPKLRIIIENKVSTTEHDDQTQKYAEYYKGKADEINLFVFLTPKPSIELDAQTEASCSCKKFIEINYQDILNYILEPILKKDNISYKTKFLISEYIHTLSVPALEEKNDKKNNNNSKKSIIMAIGKEERDLLTAFWENNKGLINAAITAISEDASQDPEIHEQARIAKDAITSLSSRDTSKYQYKRQSFSKPKLVYEVVKDYVATNPSITFAELKKVFPDNLGLSNYCVFADKEYTQTYKENAYNSDAIKLTDTKIYTANFWKENFQDFLNHIKKLGINVTKL